MWCISNNKPYPWNSRQKCHEICDLRKEVDTSGLLPSDIDNYTCTILNMFYTFLVYNLIFLAAFTLEVSLLVLPGELTLCIHDSFTELVVHTCKCLLSYKELVA